MPRKRTAKAQPQPLGDFTDQLRAGAGFADAAVPVMPGERREATKTRRRQCPAMGWSFLSQQQRAGLVALAHAIDAAGYGAVKSCLAEPVGGDIRAAERRFMARSRLASMLNAVAAVDQVARFVVTEALVAERETLDDLAARLLGGGRADGREAMRRHLAVAADAVLAFLAAEQRGKLRAV